MSHNGFLVLTLVALTLVTSCATKQHKPSFNRGNNSNAKYEAMLNDFIHINNKVRITKTNGVVIELWVKKMSNGYISNTSKENPSKNKKPHKIKIADIERVEVLYDSPDEFYENAQPIFSMFHLFYSVVLLYFLIAF